MKSMDFSPTSLSNQRGLNPPHLSMKLLPHSIDTSSIVRHVDYGGKDDVPLKQSRDAL
jgi:hypothetical protein